jgi:hypothetical protein
MQEKATDPTSDVTSERRAITPHIMDIMAKAPIGLNV